LELLLFCPEALEFWLLLDCELPDVFALED
jgi:hypothetical protein